MTYILHLGHQPTDISGISGLLSTVAGGFDPTLDMNAIRFSGTRPFQSQFSLSHAAPVGDLWLGFRYVPPNGDANVIADAAANFLEFYDGQDNRIAQIRPLTTTSRYHAFAHGDISVQGSSSYVAANGQPQWVDVRLAVANSITIELYIDGVLQSTALAPNTAAKGKPQRVIFANSNLHSGFITRIWYYAHIAVLDGVSTIGRRFVRRSPASLATFNQMTGAIDALKDEDVSTRIASNLAGQRVSFTLTGPTGPIANTAIAAVHLKQLTQGGTSGPTNTAGFLRIGSANFDAVARPVPTIAPKPIYSTWAQNPSTAALWTSASLPTEVGILSA